MLETLKSLASLLTYHCVRVVFGGEAGARYLGVKVGAECRIYMTAFGSEPWLVEIGNRVTISRGVSIITHDGSGWLANDDRGRRYRFAKVVIGDEVFIGLGAILLPGVRIGNQVVVGAGSVVTKSVPSGTIVGGNPARMIGRYDEFQAHVLREWRGKWEMRGNDYRSQIESIVESGFKRPVDARVNR